MKKIYLIMVLTLVCLTCFGCGRKDVTENFCDKLITTVDVNIYYIVDIYGNKRCVVEEENATHALLISCKLGYFKKTYIMFKYDCCTTTVGQFVPYGRYCEVVEEYKI